MKLDVLHFERAALIRSAYSEEADQARAEVIKTFFFMLNPVEHEIFNAHKYENIKKFGFFYVQISLECYFSRS